MVYSQEFTDFVVESLEPLGPVQGRRMFGGAGIFCDGLMFGLIADGRLFFKVDDLTEPDFIARGLSPFTYRRSGGRQGVMSYYEAPEDLFDDHDSLLAWGQQALKAAYRSRKV